MRGILLPGLMFAAVTFVNVIVPFDAAPGALPLPLQSAAVAFGVYDPHQQLASDPGVAIDHVFIDWNQPPEQTAAALQAAGTRKRALMVTLEPFPRAGQKPESFSEDILAGDYDGLLRAHCQALSQPAGRVFLRFAHEMDLDNARYAWSGLPAETYIAVYRHAVGICRGLVHALVAVWSPVGNAGLARYFPGDDVVDMVGLSLFGLQPWEEIAYGRGRSFAEALTEKYNRVAEYGKPVTIAEFGVCGSPVYRAQWLAAAMGNAPLRFPLLRSIVYFNDRETFRWPGAEAMRLSAGCDVEYPDWRLRR